MKERTPKAAKSSTSTAKTPQTQTKQPRKRVKKEPTLIRAFNVVLKNAKNSELNDEFWEECQGAFGFLYTKLHLTPIQCVLVAILLNADSKQSWTEIGEFLDIPRLAAMEYMDDMDALIWSGWALRRYDCFDEDQESFELVKGVPKAILHNEIFAPQGLKVETLQELIDKIIVRFEEGIEPNRTYFLDDAIWMNSLIQSNLHIPFCQTVHNFRDINHQTLFLLAVALYALHAGSKSESLDFDRVDSLFLADFNVDYLRAKLENGEHFLLKNGYLEYNCDNGLADNHRYILTRKVKEEMLKDYKLTAVSTGDNFAGDPLLTSHTKITPKELFFNPKEKQQLHRLKDLLQEDTFVEIQNRLMQAGMRRGFACLFYGGPGTGKTESVLQLARETGRNLMQVDISTIRTKWVGESEKNIKTLFDRYRQICEKSTVKPILFFNEADAIIGRRSDKADSSVERMDNSLQNIILQELENLDGILIATTNLTSNFDPAFERRFLYKIEFCKPETKVKTLIWQSMLHELSEEEAQTLAQTYDFSGGQIENVARKRIVDSILYGTPASFQDIKEYCQTEIITPLANSRPKIGF